MVVVGEGPGGGKAVELGLAWEGVDADAVESRARGLAARVAADPELARVTVGNFRKETATPVSWEMATQFERPAQMWSMRRQATRD